MRRVVLSTLLLCAAAAPLAAQRTVSLPARDRMLGDLPTPLVTIGREEGEGWELLSNVSGVDFDARDQLYILDAGNHRVVVVDPRGRLVRTIGKRGGGPGELLAPSGLAVLQDGSIAVADLGRGAFSIFGSDGAFRFNIPFVDSLGHPTPEQRGSAPSVQAHPSGLAVFGGLRINLAGPEGGASATPPADVPVHLRPVSEKAAPRTLFRIQREPPLMRTSGSENRRSVRSVPRAFTPQPGWAVLADGRFIAVHGNSPEYRLHVFDANGRTVGTITRALQPRRVTRADQERAREQLAERMRSGTGMIRMEVRAGAGGVQRSVSTGGAGDRGPSEQDIAEQLKEMQFAEVIPVVSGLRADPLGRVWVGRAPERVGDDGAIDLITANGRYIGTLAPQPLPDAISRTGLAAYVTLTDDGVEQVILKRLPASWK